MGAAVSPGEVLTAALKERKLGVEVPIDLPGADLSGFHLPGSDLVGANLRGADLSSAVLAGSCLARADLRDTNLIGACLDGADLTDADLRGSDLVGARIDDAVFVNARLEGACLLAVMGDPLSMTAARMDRRTVRLSEFSMRDIAEMVVRGVQINEQESVAPSVAPVVLEPDVGIPSVPPTSVDPKSSGEDTRVRKGPSDALALSSSAGFPATQVGPVSVRTLSFVPPSGQESIVPSIREAEVSLRHTLALSGGGPASQRRFLELNALMDAAHIQQSEAALSLRPQVSAVERMKALAFQFPEVGDEYLGVQITEELPPGTSSRCFRGTGSEGESLIVRIFDPACGGAALQLPAFQRGLRALNKLATLDGNLIRVAELVVVAADQTSYVMKDYRGGTLQDLVEGSLSLKEGLLAVQGLCESVEEIHDCGLMVRSWKPSNLFVEGKQLVIGELDMVHLTTLSQYRADLAGYRSYAAPEEIQGEGTRSPTADVFSLGKILEYVLIREEPVTPLGGTRLIESRDNFPQVLVNIVKRATAQDAAERYQGASLLAHDLSVFQLEGDRAVLAASIRPQTVSQLSVPPLSHRWQRPDVAKVIEEHKLRVRPQAKPKRLGGLRQVEISAALLGGLSGLVLTLLLLVLPSTVDKLESLSPYLGALVGLLVLALPPPTSNRAMVRVASWTFVAGAFWLLDPLQLASVAWKSRLSSGTVHERAMAAQNLARVGKGDFSGAELSGVTLSGMDLASVDFTEANLSEADLSSALLVETRFEGANLDGTRFEGANLFGAQLEGALGFEEASCDRYTILPEEWICRRGYLATAPVGSPTSSAQSGPASQRTVSTQPPE